MRQSCRRRGMRNRGDYTQISEGVGLSDICTEQSWPLAGSGKRGCLLHSKGTMALGNKENPI